MVRYELLSDILRIYKTPHSSSLLLKKEVQKHFMYTHVAKLTLHESNQIYEYIVYLASSHSFRGPLLLLLLLLIRMCGSTCYAVINGSLRVLFVVHKTPIMRTTTPDRLFCLLIAEHTIANYLVNKLEVDLGE